MDNLESTALGLLRRLTGRDDASFRAGQLDAIRALVGPKKRVLVVQRTGWGKSAVYFIATRMLRDEGAGPTLLVSPLLALMRNQMVAAGRMGVRAATINSSNTAEWDAITSSIRAGDVDLLLISPERLANTEFRESVLDPVGARAGLLVIDEAHCISDWGHDFRPDYRRIRRLLPILPPTVPVLACTATANDRVVDDVVTQLGDTLEVFRGPLARAGLALQVIDLDSPAARMAWLVQTLGQIPGSGIVYCLTKRDAETVAEWLSRNGIPAACYTGTSEGREETERALLHDDVRAVVATSALGMGFDKANLAFVIHFQSPGSTIAYYQQVGRAGRQLPDSVGVLLRGREDAEIQDWFITSAFPTEDECRQVLDMLEASGGFVRLRDLEAAVNVRPSRIQNLMKNLEADGVIVSDGQKYQRTAQPFAYDTDRVAAITALRRTEQQAMAAYGTLGAGCRMAFLGDMLDDPHASPCGICDLCAGPRFSSDVDQTLARDAAQFLRHRPVVIEPRRRWPDGRRIPIEHQLSVGRALCRLGDGGWGEVVRHGRQVGGCFDVELVDAVLQLWEGWRPDPRPAWVTWVPSRTHPELVPTVARQLATALGLPAREAVVKTSDNQPQTLMQNSTQQLANVAGAFAVSGSVPGTPVLLVDDLVDSRWTLTHVGALLREAGSGEVMPLTLAHSGR